MAQEESAPPEDRVTTHGPQDTTAPDAQTPPLPHPADQDPARAATADTPPASPRAPPAARSATTPHRLARAISYILAQPDPRERARESCRAHTNAVLRRAGVALEGRTARRTRRPRDGEHAPSVEQVLRRGGLETRGVTGPVLSAAAAAVGEAGVQPPEPRTPPPRVPPPPPEPHPVYQAAEYVSNGVFALGYALSQMRDVEG
ncbi:hypothetical protein PsYK624_027760 [Phanerochaete sordida]|uniref:Uncharacterized protein n=1 Tax=Phanerochaete sordida TaxID=48140 RepID=A0A9P3L924_9APHY|nr:hypothetical protein PsYK624_027760 [Phanerochaete sordida]